MAESMQLVRWGQVAAFQKALSDQLHQMIIEHHHRTLSDSHPGSVYRSLAFFLLELFSDSIPRIFGMSFEAELTLLRLQIKIKPRLGDPIQVSIGKGSSDKSKTGSIGHKLKHEGSFDLLDCAEAVGIFTEREDENENPILGLDDGAGDVDVLFSFSVAGIEKKSFEKTIEPFATTLKQILPLVKREFLEIGLGNQAYGGLLLSESDSIFESKEAYLSFFSALLKTARRSFAEARSVDWESQKLQLMLYVPTSKDGKHSLDSGVFFYPNFLSDGEVNYAKERQSDSVRTTPNDESKTFEDFFNNVLVDIFIEVEKEIPIDRTDFKELFSGAFTKTENFIRGLRPGRGEPPKTEFKRFCEWVFGSRYMKGRIVIEKLNVKKSWRENPHLLVALFELFRCWTQYGAIDVPKQLSSSSEKLRSLFETIFADAKKDAKEKLGELRPGGGKVEVSLWKEAKEYSQLDVYQMANQGVVGKFIKHLIPIRMKDQEVDALFLTGRASAPYALMGLLEGQLGIGGGELPAAIAPLTACGQLLGVLFVIDGTGKGYTASDMLTLEFLGRCLAQRIQEAKDSFVLRRLDTVTDRGEPAGRIEAISCFLAGVAIVTNVIKAEVQILNEPPGRSGREAPTSPWLELKPASEGSPAAWDFFIPPEIWKVTGKAVEYWQLSLQFAEPCDVIENYRSSIEFLFRVLLHSLGLRASGTGIVPEQAPWLTELEKRKPRPGIEMNAAVEVLNLDARARLDSRILEDPNLASQLARKLESADEELETYTCGNEKCVGLFYSTENDKKPRNFSRCCECFWQSALSKASARRVERSWEIQVSPTQEELAVQRVRSVLIKTILDDLPRGKNKSRDNIQDDVISELNHGNE